MVLEMPRADINQELPTFNMGTVKAIEVKFSRPVLMALYGNQDKALSMTELGIALERYQFGSKMETVHKPNPVSIRKAVQVLEFAKLVWVHYHGIEKRVRLTSWGKCLCDNLIELSATLKVLPYAEL